MSTSGVSPPVICSSAEFDVEFRSILDDAWYSAQVIVDGDTLTVKFEDFPEPVYHEVFNAAGSFATSEAVDEFRKRFRPVSIPLEDSECSKVVEGTIVCGTFKDDGQVRFFDAIVEGVKYEEHPSDKCLCAFMLLWQHGPAEGNITSTNITDICLFSSDTPNTRVDKFTNLAKEKLKVASQRSTSASASASSEISFGKESDCNTQNMCSPTKSRLSSSQHKYQENGSAGLFFDRGLITKERARICFQQSDQDRDVGGIKEMGKQHYMIIENLEKDLSASSIIEFIHKQTSITPQAYVFPSLSSESCARGIVVLGCRMKLKRIYEFLNNPNHFIVSLTGRPWVIAENTLRSGNLKETLGSLPPTSQKKDVDIKLKVVRLGTEEYVRAKRLRCLYEEFHDHLNGLRKRLGLEESRVLHSSSTT